MKTLLLALLVVTLADTAHAAPRKKGPHRVDICGPIIPPRPFDARSMTGKPVLNFGVHVIARHEEPRTLVEGRTHFAPPDAP